MAKKNEWPIGLTITDVRPMTQEEEAKEGWSGHREHAMVLELSDGTKLYPSRDPEGNGPGMLFGIDPEKKTVTLYAERRC